MAALSSYLEFIENGHIKLFNISKEMKPKYDATCLVDDINKHLKKLEEDILSFTNMKIEDYDIEVIFLYLYIEKIY